MSLETLPAEVITIIVARLSVQQLNRLAITCRSLYAVCNRILYETEIRHQTFSSTKTSCLLWAARKGRLGTVQKAALYGASVTGPPRELARQTLDDPYYDGREVYTTLYYAIIGQQYEMAAYLLNNEYDIHTPVLATYRHRKRLATRPGFAHLDELIECYQDDSHNSYTNAYPAIADYENISSGSDTDSEPESHVSSLPSSGQTVRTGTGEVRPTRTVSLLSTGTRSDVSEAICHLHFPLLLALDREATHGDCRIAKMIIAKGGFLVRPGRTALVYNIVYWPRMPQPAASDRMRRLLAQSPKVVQGDFNQQSRTVVPYAEGVAQTQEDKLKTLDLLCGGAGNGLWDLSPLAYSAWIGRSDLVQIALAFYGNSLTVNDLWGDHDVLSLAVLSGDIPTVDVILQHFSTPQTVTIESLQLAAKSDNDGMLPFLYHHHGSYTYLSNAAGFGQVIGALSDNEGTEMLRQVLNLAQLTHEDLRYMSIDDRRYFFRAASTHNIDGLRVLLSYRPIARNSACLWPQNALHFACENYTRRNAYQTIRLLVRHGVPIDGCRQLGPTTEGFLLSPLQYALYLGNMEFARALLKFDHNLSSKPVDSIPLLYFAILGCKQASSDRTAAAVVKALIRRGERVGARLQCTPRGIQDLRPLLSARELAILQDWRCTPLLFAALCRAPVSVVDALISGGASVNSTEYYNQHKFSPLNALVFDGLLDMRASAPMVQKLVHAGARLDDRRGYAWGSALDRACSASRALWCRCKAFPESECGLRYRRRDHRALKVLMGCATRDTLSAEHVSHNLDNYYVEHEEGGRWMARSSLSLFERDASPAVNVILRDFLRRQYPEYPHRHISGFVYYASRLLGY